MSEAPPLAVGGPGGAGRADGRPPHPALWAAVAFVLGRALTLAAGLAAWSGGPAPPHAGRWLGADPALLTGGVLARLVDPWIAWDGLWYASVAAHGYVTPESVAFFPSYPLLLRAVMRLAPGPSLAGVLLSLVCSALAVVLLFVMVRARWDGQTAAWTVAFLSLCPAGLFFGAAYAESLFLLLVLGSFVLAERGMWIAACAVGALAALTRNVGVLVVLPLFFLYAERRGWTWKRARPAWPQDARLAWLVLVPAGLGVYALYLWSRFGDALAFVTAQSAWGRSFAWPVVTVWRGAQQAGHALRVSAGRWPFSWAWLGPGGDGQWMNSIVLLPFVALVAAVVVLACAWRRLPFAYSVWALAVMLAPLFTPAANQALLSYPRFLLLAFPLFIGVVLLTGRYRLARWLLLAGGAILLVWLSASFALFSWAA